MRKLLLSCGLAMYMCALVGFTDDQSSISGKVTPADGAETVWAISGTDSTKATINSGTFSLSVKPGIYKLIIDAKEPYRDVLLENLEVKAEQPIDVGEIVLQK